MHDFFQGIAQQFQRPLQDSVLIFSLVLVVILLSTLVPKRLKIPGIIGLIVSGIIIGPSGLDLLSRNSFVDVLATVGLLYIMFIAGLELDLHEFRANRNKSLAFGALTFFVPLGIGYPLCFYLLGFDVYGSLLIASIFATHTLVTYPIVSRLGATKDASVAMTVGGTILADTAVLLMLAIILGASQGGLTPAFWIRITISFIIYAAFMWQVVPRIATWFFQKLENEKHSHYIFVLAVVFLSGFLARVAGLEPIIGAFAAGLALNPLIPNSSALMNRIEFMGNALFIPFFLVSVGMIVDVSIIFHGYRAIAIAGTMTVVAIIGKYLAAWGTQKLFRLSTDQRHLIFGLSSAHAAATLAVVLVGYQAGIVGESALNAIILIILVTCMLASVVTERAARRIVETSHEVEDERLVAEIGMEQILISISHAHQIERLLHFAVLIKAADSTHPLRLLNVVPNTDTAERSVAAVKKKMKEFLSESTATETEVKVMATIDYSTPSGIARAARENAADLIILGWPKREGILDRLTGERMGSTLHHTVRTLMVCSFSKPLATHTGLFVIVPANAEYEEGFPIWLGKLARLSTELTAPIRMNCTERTRHAVERFLEKNNLKVGIEFSISKYYTRIINMAKFTREADIVVVVAARKGAISYNYHMDRLLTRVERYSGNLDRIVVYP